MLGLPKLDRDAEGRHREHAAALHPRSCRGSCRLSLDPTAPPIILALDAAGSACSVAVGRGSTILAARTQPMRHGHAEVLMPMVDATMRAGGLRPAELDAVAVSLGPGGFTGIRVGLAAAHGIVVANGARLIGVTSFAAAAAMIPEPLPGPLLVALDSRRADLYVQLFSPARAPLGAAAAVSPEQLADWVAERLGTEPVLIAGDASDAGAAAIAGRFAASVAQNSAPDARGVFGEAVRVIAGNVGGAAPRALYLRPPDVTIAAPPASRPVRKTAARRIGPLPALAAGPLALLHRACFPDDPWDAEALARIMGLSGCFGRLAWDGETPAGFVLARDLGNECEVLSIGVAPDRRRRGTGGRLMMAVLAEARRRGISSVVLEVAAGNEAAQSLYGRLGFAPVGRRPRYYRRAGAMEDALIMRLNLRNSRTLV